MRRPLACLLALCLLPPLAAVAQGEPDGCPEGSVCVEWQGHTVEVDPRWGAVCYVVEIRTVVTATLDGTTTTKGADCALLVESGDTYKAVDDAVRLTPEQAAVAELGEPLVLRMDP